MIALGSPGMRISVAVTRPPETPPTNNAISSTTASMLCMLKVNGSTSTISVPVLMPGRTPMAMPEQDAAAHQQHDVRLEQMQERGAERHDGVDHALQCA